MANEWQTVRVEDIAEKIAMGPFGSNIKVETFVEAGVPVISGAHLRGVRLDDGDFNFVTDEHAERMKNSNVFRGDVIFTHAGNIGQVAYIPPNSQYARYVISQRQFYLRCDLSKADPAFVSYFFHSNDGQHKLLANASQTGVPSIARPSSYLKTIELSLPPLAEQRAIAHILGTLDDKIELNRKQNETLEAMARALFKAWFVDFEPVRAKMEGRARQDGARSGQPRTPQASGLPWPGAEAGAGAEGWQRGQSLPGLPAHLYDLFPDRLVDSELGEIPDGWRVDSVYDIADVRYGAPFASSKFNTVGDGLPLVRIRDLRDERPGVWTPEVHPKGYVIQPGDIIVGMDGEFRAYLWGGQPAWMNQRICAFHPRSPYCAAFVHNSITPHLAYVEATEVATTVIHLGKGDIDRFRVVAPSGEVAKEFERLCQPLYDKIVARKQQSRTLAQLRETLLPKLISGQLRVPDAESIVGAAV